MVNIIVAGNSTTVQAAKQATETIPIVMLAVADPVTSGFIASLARPGGNIMGLSLMSPELVGKQLELLKEVFPQVSLQPLEARDRREIDSAFAAITAPGPSSFSRIQCWRPASSQLIVQTC